MQRWIVDGYSADEPVAQTLDAGSKIGKSEQYGDRFVPLWVLEEFPHQQNSQGGLAHTRITEHHKASSF
jgi:hypothetical protein